MSIVEVREGTSPLILGVPHVGTMLPPEVTVALNDLGRAVPDTDWWLDRLYGFADEFSPTIVAARLSRYVIDVNRDPSGISLYPGQATTELCPVITFDGDPIYRADAIPDAAEIGRRRTLYFKPYHAALADIIGQTKARHGYAVLYDCHSIRSVVPRLFEGQLPVLNIGTNDGTSCARAIEQAAVEAASASGLTWVANGRFKGGWITRHYGHPRDNVHAVQMELAQSAYMREEPPWTYLPDKAERLAGALRAILSVILEAAANLPKPLP